MDAGRAKKLPVATLKVSPVTTEIGQLNKIWKCLCVFFVIKNLTDAWIVIFYLISKHFIDMWCCTIKRNNRNWNTHKCCSGLLIFDRHQAFLPDNLTLLVYNHQSTRLSEHASNTTAPFHIFHPKHIFRLRCNYYQLLTNKKSSTIQDFLFLFQDILFMHYQTQF